MNIQTSRPLTRTWLLATAAAALIPAIAAAQGSEKLSSEHIPDDAIVAVFLSPSKIMSSPEWELMPTEVIQAAGIEYVGIDPMDIDDVQVVVGMPGPAGPQAGAVIRFSKDYKISDLNPKISSELEQQEVEGISVYRSQQPPVIQLHQPDARSLFVCGGGYLKPMLDVTESGTGQLPTLISKDLTSRRRDHDCRVGPHPTDGHWTASAASKSVASAVAGPGQRRRTVRRFVGQHYPWHDDGDTQCFAARA